MFRITSRHEDDELVLKLEGCLAGAWVGELDAYWRDTTSPHGGTLRVDLRDICHVDESGRELLARMHRAGARFVTAGCFTPELVREIAESEDADRSSWHVPGRAAGRRD